MTKLYKLTDKDGYTRPGEYNALQWSVGVTHKAVKRGRELCTDQVIHAYTSQFLAVVLNPIHADIKSPRLWLCDGRVVADDNGLKVGVKSLTVKQELALPAVTADMRVKFALLCASQVYKNKNFLLFVDNWLSGKDRSIQAADLAARAAAAEWAAEWAARAAAEWAARAAADLAARAAAARPARAAAEWATEWAARAARAAAAECAAD